MPDKTRQNARFHLADMILIGRPDTKMPDIIHQTVRLHVAYRIQKQNF
jgi:hypothetical protein